MNFKEKYGLYMRGLTVNHLYANRNAMGFKDILVQCPICGFVTNLNGCTSHSKLHKEIYQIKRQKIKEFLFRGECIDFCLVCGKPLIWLKQNGSVDSSQLVTCCFKCAQELQTFTKRYQTKLKKCEICGKQFITTCKAKTCSQGCYKTLLGMNSKAWHCKMKNTQQYTNMYRKISTSERNTRANLSSIPWNRGITGEQYIKHYQKQDGINTLYQSIKRNSSFFKKTHPEVTFQQLLKELNIDYKYCIFVKNRQFDFLLKFKNCNIVVQVDGDYWHKSKERCNDENLRKMVRLSDSLKQKVIYQNRKGWSVIRIWESDLERDIDNIKMYFQKIKEQSSGNELDKIRNTICEIKEYYLKKS